MLDNIIVKVPNIFDLRAYLKQLINENDSRLKVERDYFAHMDPDFLNDDELLNLLNKYWLLPEYLFFFKRVESSLNGENLKSGTQKIPIFFTNVIDVYCINYRMELIVMQNFNRPNFTLYDKYFQELIGDCEMIRIGTNGKILVRYTESYCLDYFNYDGRKLDFIYSCISSNDLEDFHPIYGPNVEIYHPNKNENPQLILKEVAPCKNIKNAGVEFQSVDELSDLPW
jgi:hypothetical protein